MKVPASCHGNQWLYKIDSHGKHNPSEEIPDPYQPFTGSGKLAHISGKERQNKKRQTETDAQGKEYEKTEQGVAPLGNHGEKPYDKWTYTGSSNDAECQPHKE